MASPLNRDGITPLQRPRSNWIDWAWLAFAAAVVVVVGVGCLRAGRSFWHLACEHSSSPSSQRA